MQKRLTPFFQRLRALGASFAGVIALFVVTLAGILWLTGRSLQDQRSEALVIDLAGRQRMLNSRHFGEIVLASHGLISNYPYTRRMLQETLSALIYGGPAVRTLGSPQTVDLPPMAITTIRNKLFEQQRLYSEFVEHADRFLALTPADPHYAPALAQLRTLSEALHTEADDAVRMLAVYSEDKASSTLRWQIAVALLVGAFGVWFTRQVMRANHEREREMSERQRAEQALLVSQNEVLEAVQHSDALKSALLSSISHELRTPLTNIKSMVTRAFHGPTADREAARQEYLEPIDRQIDALTRLFENLLDMSAIEAGAKKPKRDWELFEDLVEGAVAALEKPLRGRRLEIDLEDELPPLLIDGLQIRQVLVNLLDNAVKYSPDDSAIALSAGRRGRFAEVTIISSGEPIPKEDLERIFDRFYRVRQTVRAIGGTGLGLAICKGIVEAHGGRIWAESGETTTFTFTLPLAEATQRKVVFGREGAGA